MSQQDASNTAADDVRPSSVDTDKEVQPVSAESASVRISKKTGKEVRAMNEYQKFTQEKLKEKSDDGKRKFTMKQVSDLWYEKKNGKSRLEEL